MRWLHRPPLPNFGEPIHPRVQARLDRSTPVRYGRTMTFCKNDGATFQAREFFLKPSDRLAEGFITDDGRVIYCLDEEARLFWFKDTQEQLRLADDESAPA